MQAPSEMAFSWEGSLEESASYPIVGMPLGTNRGPGKCCKEPQSRLGTIPGSLWT